MGNGSIDWRRVASGTGLWTLLYLGVSAAFYLLFSLFGGAGTATVPLVSVSFALGVAVTGLAFLAVVLDRLLFVREPTGFLTRQSVWVMVFVVLTVLATGAVLASITVSPGNAVLLGVTAALPTTMVLFAAVNLARYRSMEYRPEE